MPEQKDLEENLSAPPHVLCEKNNNGTSKKKPRSREIQSRYKSGITASTPSSVRKFGVPNVSHTVMPSDVTNHRRTQSFETAPSEVISYRRPQSSEFVPSEVTNFKRPQSVERSRISSALPGPRNVCIGLSKNNGELVDHVTKIAPDTVHGPSYSSSALDCKGTAERRASACKQRTGQSENTRPREKLPSHLKQDRNRVPSASILQLSGIRLSKSLDLMDRPTNASTVLAQGKPVAGSGRTFRRGVHDQASSQTINEGFFSAFSASKPASAVGAAGSLRGYGQERLQSFHLGKQVSSIEGASQARLTPQEAELACADRFNNDTASDSESVSSGGTISSQDAIGFGSRRSSRGRASTRRGTGTAVPARFWEETMKRVCGQSLSLSESSSTISASVRPSRNSKVLLPGTGTSGDGVLQSSESLGLVSTNQPSSGSHQPISSVKLVSTSSTLRCPSSPIKLGGRPLPPQPINYQNTHSSNAGSVVSFKGDVRKGKQGMSHLEASHMFRMLQNRLLQWHFVNAKAEATRTAQTGTAEKLLYNAWAKISELRHSVNMKQVRLQRVKQADKLSTIISGQMDYLEDISLLQHDHYSCLSGAIEALEAATVRLPVTSDVKADVQSVKEALNSASHMMQSTCSSICVLLPKVEEINSLISELAQVVAQERSLLDECSCLLERADLLAVEESSLMSHLIQLKQEKYGSLTGSMENGAPVV